MPTSHSLPILLKTLRLSTISQQWQEVEKQAKQEVWSYAQYLSYLCEQEVCLRKTRRIARYQKEATLPVGKLFSTLDRDFYNPLKLEQLTPIEQQTDWVDNAQNLLLFGPSGVGKTHIGAAIGYSLVEKGKRVKFLSAIAAVQQLQLAKQELKLQEMLFKWDKYDLIIIDDIGYVKKSEAESSVLFELIAHRYESRSLLITSNQAFSEWESVFGDTMMTVAAIDRLVHHARIIDFTGEQSFRKQQAAQQQSHPPES
jgi:DNA replication protein DnaC